MRSLAGLVLLLGLFQDARAQRDSVWLRCPLEEAVIVPPPKNAIRFDEPDFCVVLQSVPDTLVKACVLGKVSNVVQTEDGKWDVVFYYRDYYFWYSGLKQVFVRKYDNLKTGQPLGSIDPGERLELTMYRFETPIDPVRFMGCRRVLQ